MSKNLTEALEERCLCWLTVPRYAVHHGGEIVVSGQWRLVT